MRINSILITGCSSGIGYIAAQKLKERGYRVFASARKEEDVARLQAEGFESVQLDVNNAESMQRALDHILRLTGGTLDALFNNSGFVQAGAVEDLTREINLQQFETNVFGPMELIRLVMPIMRKQGYGRIIQNSSILGIITVPYSGAYNASKYALEGFSNTLRQELRGTDIHVAIINPGPIASNLRKNAYQLYKETLMKEHTGVHTAMYEKMEKSYFTRSGADKQLASHPESVVPKLIHALESKRPKAHYYVGWPAHGLAFLRRMLPDCALDWILSKVR